MESTLTSKGQTTLPKAIREHLGLRAGDRILYLIRADGTVALLPRLPATAVKGIVDAKGRRVSVAAMNQAIARGATAGQARR